VAVGFHLGVKARAAVASLDLLVDRRDLHQQAVAAVLPLAWGAILPGVVIRGRNLQNVGHDANGPGVLVLIEEGVDHGDSRAKRAVAFFRMSLSMRRRLFSSWRRRISARLEKQLKRRPKEMGLEVIKRESDGPPG
jgi:hypothetical protein